MLKSVSSTMANVTPAKDIMRKLDKKIGKIEAELKKLKVNKKDPLDKIMSQKTKDQIQKDCKDLKKYAEDNSLSEWASAAKSTIDLAKEVAKLF